MNSTDRELVERRWQDLEAVPPTGERRVRVAQLPTETVNGPLAVAVDHDGHRHLLVPISPHQNVRHGLDGPALVLRKRPLEDEDTYQTYADLACFRTDLNDLFTLFCIDVLKTTESIPNNPIKALNRELDRWKALFESKGTPLGPEQLAGLFGELTVLTRLLEANPSSHRLWRGPSHHRHDFVAGATAVEVKTSTSGEGRRTRIHGLDQLEAPTGGTLTLAWYRLERTSAEGTGLLELVDQALRTCDDESSLLGLLAEAGYHPSDTEHYRDVRFSVLEQRWYEVDAVFPKLTGNDLAAAGIPINVLDVAYTIDLSIEPPIPMAQDRVEEQLITMVQEGR